MSRQSALAFLVAAVASASIWAVSPVLTGHSEPWDADGFFYVGALVVAGLISGALRPRPLWAHYVGWITGQLAYEVLFLQVGPLILLGAVFLLGFSAIFLAAAALAAFLRQRISPAR
jgi:hypothetical protein